MPARVLLCDDHPLFRQGVGRLLETVEDLEVVGEVGRGDEVCEAVGRLRPDVLVLDLELPGASGIAVVEMLRAEPSPPRILILSGFSDPARVRAALRAGADGYVLKNAPAREIIEAIRSVASGSSVLGEAVVATVATSLRGEPEEERFRRQLASLSDRELDVLRLAAEGETNAGIGRRLFISEGTVKNHMTQVLRKLSAQDRTQAAILAVKHGVVR